MLPVLPLLPVPIADAIQRSGLPPESVGLYVQELATGKVVAAFHEDAPFNPASTMKLVTSNAALELLGPTFTWKTQAFADGAQQGDVLRGDLVIRGSGDPKLVLESLWLFLRKLRARGIRDIQGNLLLDRSAFEEVPEDASAFDGDPLKPYNVGPDALLLNYKALALRLVPDEARHRVDVSIDPPLQHYGLQPPRLVKGECGDWKARLQPMLDGDGARFGGGYPLSCGEKAWYIHPWQMSHARYFELVFRRMWADMGGQLRGEVRPGAPSPQARLVTEWESAPLSEIIRDINKYSNNVMARQLLLTLAYKAYAMPANTARGAAAVRAWLTAKGIQAPELVIENGSGLSRVERIAPATLGRILAASFQAPTMPEFMSSMPLVGYDGTMRSRLKDQSVAGRAHVKTGMLNDVRAVAGYVLAASGKRYVVTCLVNHPEAGRAVEMQDLLLQWVYLNG
ncbi:D-alanyl-D-alanine carboxypeptidase/D-alanyl-D-alanine endopeptidase [Noviherbaspirillum galbum]|uniref:D-alanyl-D-alanine carboxypeptidase/D-alanyl-D-alanine endopeptidase n=1 Tax=Noviherbaspirillum galbum TaxID=2709383 RepID=UPI002E2D2577|nr:D-alanyl-D-alanine carboxypeptidase/D-alanyl-D-alanine-endopeptidase [Noviherbaspirillum galbum]